jgi:hypothetical protein
MVTTVIGAVVPLFSALMGLTLTYWINVRTRKTTFIEDLFNNAIAAVAVADASIDYIRGIARPAEMPEDDHRDLLVNMARAAVENNIKRTTEAREALARLLPYAPWVQPYYEDPATLTHDRLQEVIRLLVAAKGR